MRHLFRFLALGCCLWLAACGGGGGGDSSIGSTQPTFSVSAGTLTFSAATPTSATPVSQAVVGTVTGTVSGTLYILINVSGAAVTDVSNVTITGNSGQAIVRVAAPAALGSGTFTSTIQVRACLNDSTCASGQLSGSPQTINVNYTIGAPVIADAVMPHVIMDSPGQVVIRGHSFSGATSVSFGSNAATSFTIVSPSEIRAAYPALSAGTYPIVINGGAIAFSESVKVVAPPTYPATLLSFPEQPLLVRRVIYDAARNALFVVARFSTSADVNAKLWKFTHSGASWSAATVVTISDLQDISLSANGSRLLVLTGQSMLEYDPDNVTAGATRTVAVPGNLLSQLLPITDTTFLSDTSHPVGMEAFAIANDGTAIVTGHYLDVDYRLTYAYFYSISDGTFTKIQPVASFGLFATAAAGYSPQIAASADGSRLLLTSARNLGDPPRALLQYSASDARMSQTPATIYQSQARPVAVDAAATRIIPYSDGTASDNYNVYNASYQLLGTIPKAPGAVANAIVVNPAGTRAYLLINSSGNNNAIRTYDISGATIAGQFPIVGVDLSITSPTVSNGNVIQATVAPDGRTLFIAGDAGVSVVPLP